MERSELSEEQKTLLESLRLRKEMAPHEAVDMLPILDSLVTLGVAVYDSEDGVYRAVA